MAAAGGRRGRRDNGLDATDWRAVEDLDPRLSEEVLDLLAARGVAAYVQPAMNIDPVTRSATVPDRPRDRLYVDRHHVDAARATVRTYLGQRSGAAGGETHRDTGGETGRDAGGHAGHGTARGTDVDAAFADIVAGFDRQVDPDDVRWPAAEQTSTETTTEATTPADEEPDEPGQTSRTDTGTDPGTAPSGESRAGSPVDARGVTEPSLLDGLDTFGRDLPDQDDEEPPERFVPPPPPPLPRLAGQTVLGIVAIAVGVMLLVGRPEVLPLPRSAEMLLGFATILGGAVALILRLRPGTDPDDDTHPDDGAKV